MGHVGIPGKVNLQICVGGNGTCPDSRKSLSEFPNLSGGKLGMSRSRNKVNSQFCLGGNGACPDSRKSEFPNLFGVKLGKMDSRKRCTSTSVLVEMGHDQIPGIVNFTLDATYKASENIDNQTKKIKGKTALEVSAQKSQAQSASTQLHKTLGLSAFS